MNEFEAVDEALRRARRASLPPAKEEAAPPALATPSVKGPAGHAVFPVKTNKPDGSSWLAGLNGARGEPGTGSRVVPLETQASPTALAPASEREKHLWPYSRRPDDRKEAERLYGLQKGFCAACRKVPEGRFELDHIDDDPLNKAPANKQLLCKPCNLAKRNRAGQRSMERERESPPAVPTPTKGEWTSEEGKRSDRMVYFYRQALFHPQTGRMVTIGTKKPLKAFAADLADECGEGQAQTFERYLRDNALQGYFVVTSAKGIDWIERTGKKYPLDRLGLKPEGSSPKAITEEVYRGMALEAARERESW